MDEKLMQILKRQKSLYEKEGFHLIGVFGSFAQGKEKPESDLDLLYDLNSSFVEGRGAFHAVERLNEIRRELESLLKRKVDLATVDNPGKTFRNYALRNLIRV